MSKLKYVLSGAAMALAVTGAADAATFKFTANLDGAQQVPTPVATASAGTATLTVDDLAETLSFSLMVTGIFQSELVDVGGASGVEGVGPVHLHDAPAGQNGGVTVPFRFSAGGYSATADGFALQRTDVAFADINITTDTFADFLTGLKDRSYYVNVHTQEFGSGEIRGQLSPVPLPASVLLLLGGLAGLGGLRRVRRAA